MELSKNKSFGEVWKIVGYRTTPVPEYEVIWSSTWEPVEKLNCPEMLKSYRKMANLEGYDPPKEMTDETSDGNSAIVEFIKGHFLDDKEVLYYLVEWATAWVPADQLDCPQLIRKFHKYTEDAIAYKKARHEAIRLKLAKFKSENQDEYYESLGHTNWNSNFPSRKRKISDSSYDSAFEQSSE